MQNQRSRQHQRPRQHWMLVLLFFSITSLVEALGVSQVFAFMPQYLRQLGVVEDDIPRWVGALTSLLFIVGLPLVPLWGVWADKYSRKLVVIRSALVEALVFVLIALSQEPWHLAGSMLLVGFQLGNTGVMLAAIRDSAPKERIGTAIAIFGASSPIGFAIGPVLGGWMVDNLQRSFSEVYMLASALSLGMALLLALGFREIRPQHVPTGRLLALAFGAIKGVLTSSTTRQLFLIFGCAYLARQMVQPFLPILVEQINTNPARLASAIGLVMGVAALAGALMAPFAGAIGDRIGFQPVLFSAFAGASLLLLIMPNAPSIGWLALVVMVFGAFNATIQAMIFSMLAIEVPADRRSATLNLVYLPIYFAGIIGPVVGSMLVEQAGLVAAFVAGSVVLGLSLLLIVRRTVRGAAPDALS